MSQLACRLVTRETIALDRSKPFWLAADVLRAATAGPSAEAAELDAALHREILAYQHAPYRELNGRTPHEMGTARCARPSPKYT